MLRLATPTFCLLKPNCPRLWSSRPQQQQQQQHSLSSLRQAFSLPSVAHTRSPGWKVQVVAAQISMAPGRTALDDLKDGEFKRQASSFRNQISSDEGAEFPAVSGRYHLYISYACPWASRCYAYLKLKGLDHAIGLTVTNAKWSKTKEDEEHYGWVFPTPGNEEPDAQADPLYGARTIRELYEKASPGYSGRFTVPVLWDKEKHTIVNNESSEIIRMFNSVFNHIAKKPDLDLYPEALRKQIDEVNDWIYPTFNNGVYRCGFATKQKPYEEAFKDVFDTLDKADAILDKQRYVVGNQLTEADIRFFVTLIRFDEVYFVHFKTNKRLIREYANILNYTKDIYQTGGIADTVNMWHIKQHYYGSHPTINPYGVVPVGCNYDYSSKHDRDRFA